MLKYFVAGLGIFGIFVYMATIETINLTQNQIVHEEASSSVYIRNITKRLEGSFDKSRKSEALNISCKKYLPKTSNCLLIEIGQGFIIYNKCPYLFRATIYYRLYHMVLCCIIKYKLLWDKVIPHVCFALFWSFNGSIHKQVAT